MNEYLARWALAAGLLAASHSALAANASEGRAVFEDLCADCHTVTPGKNKRGPSLAGVLGKAAAGQPNYNYSEALRNAGIVWSPERLARFLANPKKDLPGTKMRLLSTPGQAEIAELLAWLQEQK
ncbi:cytochrome c family protein [Uliginosibacterium sp. 31-12]|uniref:c-type cytochrome n=1 Tax=Uliginosibacterium sp. 31-12 TaxID=3062781 RepID=UPI0026E3319F|nr:c-type cytochrome [Uliginosibacterium sp. 31-12]MDO6384994.1 c-type cytochrome [Uliginosibacterium sp. 31-12]